MSWVGFAVGLLIVLIALVGLVATYVLPRGRSLFELPFTGLIMAVHRLFVGLSALKRTFRSKDAVLSVAGPVAIVVLLVSFLGLLLTGYALMELPWSPGLGHAFAASGSALTTIGFARVAGPANQTLAVLAAASGAVTVALQIGYLPVIYQSYERRESLVTLLESRAGVPSWGPEVLYRHQLVRANDTLPVLYRDWEMWAGDLAESHATHPVLIIFRSPVAGYSWLLSLLAVLDAAALHLSLCPATAPSQARMCLRMGFSSLRRIARAVGMRVAFDPHPDDAIELTFSEFSLAVDQLKELGFPVERTAEEAWPHFRGWRVNYEHLAYELADLLLAPHAPWSGGRHHLPADVVLPDRPPHRQPSGEVIAYRAMRAGAEFPGSE